MKREKQLNFIKKQPIGLKRPYLIILCLTLATLIPMFMQKAVLAEQATSSYCNIYQSGNSSPSGQAAIGTGYIYRSLIIQAYAGDVNVKGGLIDKTCYVPNTWKLADGTVSAYQAYLGRSFETHQGAPIVAVGTKLPFEPAPGYGHQISSGDEELFQDDAMIANFNSTNISCIGIFPCGNVYERGVGPLPSLAPGYTGEVRDDAIRGAGLLDITPMNLDGDGTYKIGVPAVRFIIGNTWNGNYEGKMIITMKYKQIPPDEDEDDDDPGPSGVWDIEPDTPVVSNVVFNNGLSQWQWTMSNLSATNKGGGQVRLKFIDYIPYEDENGETQYEEQIRYEYPTDLVSEYAFFDNNNSQIGGWNQLGALGNGTQMGAGQQLTIASNQLGSRSFTGFQPGYSVCVRNVARNVGGVTDSQSVSDIGPIESRTCKSFPDAPLVSILDSGVTAGAGFDTDQIVASGYCGAAGANGYIRTLHTKNTAKGSFADYSALATGNIFNSAQWYGFSTKHINQANYNTLLAFANTVNPPGNFNTAGPCLPDYYNYLDTASSTPFGGGNISGGGARQLFANGNITLGNVNLGAGDRVTLIVNGNVTITGNANYSYSLADSSQVPIFVLIAKGSINVAPGVTNLRGLYVAQGGTFNTCAGPSAPNQLRLNDNCNNSLTLKGAVAASAVELRRDSGGIVRGGAAETFQLSPELYLAEPFFKYKADLPLATSAVTDLPPVY